MTALTVWTVPLSLKISSVTPVLLHELDASLSLHSTAKTTNPVSATLVSFQNRPLPERFRPKEPCEASIEGSLRIPKVWALNVPVKPVLSMLDWNNTKEPVVSVPITLIEPLPAKLPFWKMISRASFDPPALNAPLFSVKVLPHRLMVKPTNVY